MTTKTTAYSPPGMATRDASFPPPPVKYTWLRGKRLTILPDPPKDPERMEQMPTIGIAFYIIKDFHAGQGDVLVGSEGYLCQSARSYPDRYVPDLIFARVDEPDTVVKIQNGYVIDEVGKPPDLVLEVASPSTGRADYTTKRDGYARLGVVEYWRFDPSGGEYHDRPLAGDLLVDGAYEPIETHYEPSGSIWGRSAALGLDLYWEEGNLRFYDYERGEFLPEYREIKGQRDAEIAGRRLAESRAEDAETRVEDAIEERDTERVRRRFAETRAEDAIEERDTERVRRQFAETRVEAEAMVRAEAEAELERLRERLRRIEERNPNTQ